MADHDPADDFAEFLTDDASTPSKPAPMRGFTLRLGQKYRELLNSLAMLDGLTPAALARELVEEGIRRRLDPAVIEHRMDMRRDELIAYARQLREDKQ